MQTKVIVKGYITNIVKIDTKCTKLVIATNIFNRDPKTGDLSKRGTIWNNFIFFDECDFLKVGMYVTVEGHMTLRKDGEKSNEYVADFIHLDLAAENKRAKGQKRKRENTVEMESIFDSMEKSDKGF